MSNRNRIIVALSGSSSPTGVPTARGADQSNTSRPMRLSTPGARDDRLRDERARRQSSGSPTFPRQRDLAASMASGTSSQRMADRPCSMTLSAWPTACNGNLIARAADVCLERGGWCYVVRETPLHAGHLRLMLQAAEAGASCSPVPGYYHRRHARRHHRPPRDEDPRSVRDRRRADRALAGLDAPRSPAATDGRELGPVVPEARWRCLEDGPNTRSD